MFAACITPRRRQAHLDRSQRVLWAFFSMLSAFGPHPDLQAMINYGFLTTEANAEVGVIRNARLRPLIESDKRTRSGTINGAAASPNQRRRPSCRSRQ